MASVKVKFRPSTVDGHEGSVYYQIIHERMVRQLVAKYRVFNSEWDYRRGNVMISGGDATRKMLLLSIRDQIRLDLDRFSKIIRNFDSVGMNYVVDDVVDEFKRYCSEYSLFNFMESLIRKFQREGRIRVSETYRSALISFRKFIDSGIYVAGKLSPGDIMLDSLTGEVMEEYECWLRDSGIVRNTASFYIRILRAVYNRAVDQGVIDNRYPFRHVYTGVDRTMKRALPIDVLKKIRRLELSCMPNLDYARDMFLMSFYFRGMSFVDMAFLRKTDLRDGYLVYCRRKTRQQIVIEWTEEMQAILDKYPENRSCYLLPIIRDHAVNERNIYRNANSKINRNLKIIASMVGVSVPLTLYVARHSWASAAKVKGIPISVISEGMGHDSEMTTRIYLASLDKSVIDRANSVILKSI